jgi:O-antigen ligase
LTFFLILLSIVLILIRPQDYIPGLQESSIVNFALIATSISWFTSSRQKLDFPQVPILLAFVACMAVSVLLSDGGGDVWDDLMKFFPSLMLFIFIATIVTSQARITTVMDLIAVCAFIIAIHSIQQYRNGVGWTGLEVLIEHDIKRIRYLGIFNDPNDLGLLLVTSLPIVFYWLEKESNPPVKVIYLGVLGVLMYGIYLTNSRGSMMATGAILLLMFWRRYGSMKAIVLGGIGGAAALGVSSRLSTLEVGEQSAWERVYAWDEGIYMMLDSPLFGVGYRNFDQLYYLTAHNSLILVLAETGLVGYTLWFTFVGSIVLLLWGLLRLQQTTVPINSNDEDDISWEEYQKIGWALFSSLIAYLITGFFLSQSYIVYVFILYGIILGYYHFGRDRFDFVSEQVFDMNELVKWGIYSALSVIGLFVMVKVLIKIAA